MQILSLIHIYAERAGDGRAGGDDGILRLEKGAAGGHGVIDQEHTHPRVKVRSLDGATGPVRLHLLADDECADRMIGVAAQRRGGRRHRIRAQREPPDRVDAEVATVLEGEARDQVQAAPAAPASAA